MATETTEEGFGRVSRVRGVVFENVTRAASAVGVVALVLLVVSTAVDAVQPFTADPAWYLILFATWLVPTAVLAGYCRRNRAAGRVAGRALVVGLAGTALAALLVLWLGGQLALLVLVAAVLPTAGTLVYLARRRRALAVGLQAAGIVVAGAGVASVGAFFLGVQTALVAAVAVGVPAALLARFFLSNPAAGRVGVRAVGIGALAAGTTAVAVVLVTGAVGAGLPSAAVALPALAAVAGVAGYGTRAASRDSGRIGLLAPFVLLAGALGGYLFHREFVVIAGATPALYAVLAGLPALAFGYRVLGTGEEGQVGLALVPVAAGGTAVALTVHDLFVVLVPTVPPAFGLAVGGPLVAYAWYVLDRDRPGRAGLAAPVVVGGGLLVGVLLAGRLGVAGPDTWLDLAFLTNGSHYRPELTGIHPALIGSLYLLVVVTFVAFPLGVGAAVYLEEYAPDNRFARFLEINIANLAGVPSVVYGLLGVAVFIRFGGLRLGAVVAGGLTLSLLILPIVIVSAQEAIRAVPDSLRQASYGMGATRWQTVRNVVLPRAIPGILTGTILALGRAVGETAPLIMVGLAPIGGVPNALTDQGTALPLQVFAWALDARELFREHVAAAGAMALLVVLLATNAVAITVRNNYQRDR